MDGIKLFFEKCEQAGIDPAQHFAKGTGKQFTHKRLRHDVPSNLNVSEPRQFAVKYYQANGTYIAWNMKLPNNYRRSVFTLSTLDAVNGIMNKDFALVPKYSVYAHSDTELVAVFTVNGIDDFISYYKNLKNV